MHVAGRAERGLRDKRRAVAPRVSSAQIAPNREVAIKPDAAGPSRSGALDELLLRQPLQVHEKLHPLRHAPARIHQRQKNPASEIPTGHDCHP